MLLDLHLELLDVLRPTLPEGGLRLTIALLAFLRSRIDLRAGVSVPPYVTQPTERTGLRPPFRFWTCVVSCVNVVSSGSGDDSEKESRRSSECSVLGAGGVAPPSDMSEAKVKPPVIYPSR